MRVFLMSPDLDFRPGDGVPPNAAELTEDLELDILLDAMAAGDSFLREVASNAVLTTVHDPAVILYRQHVLADCLSSPNIIREIYAAAVEAIESEKKVWSLMWERDAQSALHRSTEVLRLCMPPLRRLQQIAANNGALFNSEGFQRLLSMIATELDDEYLRCIEEHLGSLEFAHGVLMSAGIGIGGKVSECVLRKGPAARQSWLDRVQQWVAELAGTVDGTFVYEVSQRDEAGFRALGDLRAQGIHHVASALTQSADHVLSFFRVLRLELGFYIGCLNLREEMVQKREPMCFPEPVLHCKSELQCKGLYDICLSLKLPGRAVGNEINSERQTLVMVTGANRGGKSTFLRSVGLAYLMMQCGMLVPADSFRADVCKGIFTHFKREEDKGKKSGKLDEELSRMSTIVGSIVPGSLVLLNESFASTNEREGAEIALQIVQAFLQMDIRMFFVTHLFALAEGFFHSAMRETLFLRAERLEDGRRTFRLIEGEPLPTSFGEDLYRGIFATVG